ncbi:cation diffusion facilitator family transporter [Agromyces sp. CFH 90414]|uniref:Cation diffusion facilitator family transporter n=1 Tax=Agromyces agglutinans TaxID=2662258 RepID=A0A6I2F5N1_9MICO|nr:cation diffusion facilitator family transporter [Agromyces agglutinans]MRG59899.1 cation diffusion facilitator family transporter [Agromyces agglutinans]
MTTDETTRPASGESLTTVLVALIANGLIAIAKSIAAAITGSASMLAEAAHSWADTGNEVLLVIAERRSGRPADGRHPFGYGKDAYIWSMFAAFGLFTVGAVVSIQHGVQELIDPDPAGDFVVAYVVLGLAFVLEGVSFVRALRQARADAHRRHVQTLDHVLESSNPTLRAVFAEDAAALIGLVVAFGGVLLHQLLDSPVPDAIGSILVGVLLGVVAVVLIARNRAFLLGEPVDDGVRAAALRELLATPDIERVTALHLEFIGPGRVLLIAAVDLAGDRPEAAVAETLRRLEEAIVRREHVGAAVLTLSASDEASLPLDGSDGGWGPRPGGADGPVGGRAATDDGPDRLRA